MRYNAIYILALLFVPMQIFAQTYTYDSNNRLTKVVYGNGTTITYSFDALGNRTVKKVTGATAETFTITVAASPTGSGTVTGGGTYAKGTTLELNAIANAGYEFSKWSDGETDNPRIISVTSNKSYTAQFVLSTVIPDLTGDIVVDGKVDYQDLNALVDAYLSNAGVTDVTDIDNDNTLSIADITNLIDIINTGNSPVNNNGHKYVDLGLPSGALWATCNVGASSPEEAGGYYAWGEIEEKDSYSWATYKWCDGTQPKVTNPSLTKYCDRGGYGALDGKISLELEDDVAHVKWGGSWHIPTEAEILELINNCEHEWTTVNDVSGMIFRGANGNSIFIPAAGSKKNETLSTGEGEYWSTTLGNHSTTIPYFDFYRNNIEVYEGGLYNTQRYRGYTIRPVLSEYTPAVHKIEAPSSYLNHDLVDLGLPSGTLWATTNLGASSPEDYGCYYSWGELIGSCEGKTTFNMSNYPTDMTELLEPGETLDPKYDVTTQKWGGEWRMPTLSEFKELINTKYTSSEWTTQGGVNGYRITSIIKGFEGNSIFLPAAGIYDWDDKLRYVGEDGDYWSSTLYGGHDVANNVGYVYFDSSHISWWEEEAWYGLTIRPVVSFDAIVK
ncbi:MAG: hypothetical protein K6D37_09555 [Prevotella sp.]|nr:hypothetical protein [Prevotella sp.]